MRLIRQLRNCSRPSSRRPPWLFIFVLSNINIRTRASCHHNCTLSNYRSCSVQFYIIFLKAGFFFQCGENLVGIATIWIWRSFHRSIGREISPWNENKQKNFNCQRKSYQNMKFFKITSCNLAPCLEHNNLSSNWDLAPNFKLLQFLLVFHHTEKKTGLYHDLGKHFDNFIS